MGRDAVLSLARGLTVAQASSLPSPVRLGLFTSQQCGGSRAQGSLGFQATRLLGCPASQRCPWHLARKTDCSIRAQKEGEASHKAHSIRGDSQISSCLSLGGEGIGTSQIPKFPSLPVGPKERLLMGASQSQAASERKVGTARVTSSVGSNCHSLALTLGA